MSDNDSNIIYLGTIIPRLTGWDKNTAESLFGQYQKRASLTKPQWGLVEKLINNFNNKGEQKRQQEASAVQVQNFSKVIEIFDFAKEKGYKKTPKLRLGDKDHKITLSPAPDSGVNKGMVYVKVNNDYFGKISREGRWIVAVGRSSDGLLDKLAAFSMNPKETARKYGFATGTCCVCGRTLTDKTSIKMGIGPICAEGWGL